MMESILAGLIYNLKPKNMTAVGNTITANDLVKILDGTTAKKHVYSDEFLFEYATTNYVSAVMLAETKILIAYSDAGNSDYGTAIVGTYSDINNCWIFGSPVVFESASTTYISATALSSTSVLIAYKDGDNSSYGTSIICTISGTVPTFGSPVVFESATTNYISATALSSTSVLIAYQDGGNSSYGTSIICTISGTVPTFGSPVVFESATTNYISATALSSTSVLIAYQDNGNSSYGTSIICTISGTVPTFGSPVVFESAETGHISATKLSSTSVLIAYRDLGNSSYGTSIICTISGTVPTFGSPVVFESADTVYISAAKLNSTSVLVAYKDVGNSNYGTSIICTISGTVPTFGSPVVFESATTNYISAVALSSTSVLIAYQDGGNSNYGTIANCSISSTVPTFNSSVAKAKGVAISNETAISREVAVKMI